MSQLPDHEERRLRRVAATTPHPEATLERLIALRLGGEPLQYLEGTVAFGPLDLVVDPRVLIPRPETEQLYELAVSLVQDPEVIVDVGTGSGALALAMKHRFPHARVLATDDSDDALDVARLNAGRLTLQIEWHRGHLLDPLPGSLRGSIDLVVSNPPYVAEAEWEDLPEDVRREPRHALVAGATGNEVFDQITRQAPDWLRRGGWVVCEIGETQGEAVRAMFQGGFEAVEIRRDLAGRDRFVIGRRP